MAEFIKPHGLRQTPSRIDGHDQNPAASPGREQAEAGSAGGFADTAAAATDDDAPLRDQGREI